MENKAKRIKSNNKKSDISKKINSIDEEITENIEKLKKVDNDVYCYPLFGGVDIRPRLVDDVFTELRTNFKDCKGKLNVIIDSSGGNIDAAYNLALLFRKYAKEKLVFIIPRWAKSAATLLICSGDEIQMTPIAELGPLDPQITQFNPIEKRLEQFSPLHIESTLDLIRDEFRNGNEKLAKGLIERLQFPLTLGSFKKTLDISKQYLIKLLSSRMIKTGDKKKKAEEIAFKLTEGYADHGFCIEIEEAKSIGLNVTELTGERLDLIWNIHELNNEKEAIIKRANESRMEEIIKNLPPEILDKLPTEPPRKIKK